VLFEDEEFADLYPPVGRPGFSPGQLALVSVLQFAEDLSDRAAAQAVRTRIDWKYALGLELEDTGFYYSLLSDFRTRLVQGDTADRMLRVMLTRLTEAGLLKAGGRQRTDATYVLAAVRRLSRLELAGESLRAALEELAEIAPEWLQPLIEPEWDKRYGRKIEIRKVPGGPEAEIARAETLGREGQKVLAALWSPDAPGRLRTLPQVVILRQVWVHHYYWDEEGQLRWRDGHALPPASLRFDSPYDDAHYCTKNTEWSGYRVHYTETCEEQRPEIVVHVATTIAPVQDGQLTGQIHDDLAQVALVPAEHVVDAAYITPARVQRAQQAHGITLLGPIVADHSQQAKSRRGLWKVRLHDRLGPTAGNVPPRKDQHPGEDTPHQGPRIPPVPLRQGRLPGLPGPLPVHRLGHQAPLDRPAPTAAARDPGPKPPRPADRAMATTLCRPRRRRGDTLPDHPKQRPTTYALPRARQDARPARTYRHSLQPHPHRRLDRRNTPRTHTIKPIPHPLHPNRRMTPEDHQQSHPVDIVHC
jgi:transposase